ncbi:MAG: MotA/TolQ/ExbB proton channel family protein, partial [Leptospiraceae bacterium]|nr:MotA/TolQ/ExbB proton channel family protein [Leptospiraceae bacterium]
LNAGIAEALIATAAGLLVAIPATFAYNFLRKKSESYILTMEVQASRLKELLQG